MDPEDAVRRAAAVLAVEPDEAYRILCGALASGSPEETLCDLLGYENIELVAAAVQHRAYFCDAEVTNEEPKYVEHVIPPGKSIRVPEDELVSTRAAGADARHFGYERFNAVQSRVFPAAYQSGGNMLVCAPTGAGKTDVALLAILRELKEPRSQVVYIAPMKALATEVAAKYRRVFSGSDVPVIEYTGDTEVDAGTANKARVIVCTPEKFDVSTRRLAPLFKSIRLVVIDEIHLLGDSRGPVLEVLVARMFRMSELHQRFIRIVGLSATLPNYKDVARFIRAEHVFFFDAMYRPVPLGVTITGFKKGSKQADEQAYLLDKLGALLRNKHQALVFVNSRAQTVAVAKLVMGLTAPVPVPAPSDSEGTGKQRRGRRAQTRLTGVHEHLFLNRVGVHHAGMPRGERLAMEEYFREGKIDVLVSTSTLAWGVNLPARAVFIYGTSFYNAARGAFDDLGILDVVQIFGRAGRPQYDTAGEAVLITRASKLDMYIAMLKASKTVESSMLHHITDAMCA
ncbi:activating signal cointegrator complex subunit 3 [Pancytospora philotis]|nr:activating signal cointegrator complex subunit 3 [Pancytospora philotis]